MARIKLVCQFVAAVVIGMRILAAAHADRFRWLNQQPGTLMPTGTLQAPPASTLTPDPLEALAAPVKLLTKLALLASPK